MIFITLGTQDKPFVRLLDTIQKQIDAGVIKEKVIVQAGYTKYESTNMEIYDLVSHDEFEKYIKECNVLITHGGVGSILTGLSHNKKIIAVPRLSKYGEHTNDHQLEIVNEFAEEGYILKLDNLDNLDKFDTVYKKIAVFKPKNYKSNNNFFCKKLKEEIDKL